MSQWKVQLIHRLILGILVIANIAPAIPYGNGIQDDHHVIEISRDIHEDLAQGEWGALYSLIRNPLDAIHGRIVPLQRLYFYIIFLVFGYNFVAWGWFNCLLTILAVQLIYTLIRRLSSSSSAAIMGALLYLCYWPAYTAYYAPHWLEIPISLFIPLIYLAMLKIEELAERQPIPTVRIWAAAAGVLACLGTIIGLKETSIAFVPPVLALAAIDFWKRPKASRRIFAFIIVSLIIGSALFIVVLSTKSFAHGGYTSRYVMPNLSLTVQRALVQQTFLLTPYGPLIIIAIASLIVRVVIAIRERKLEDRLKWRLALAMSPLLTVTALLPWPDRDPRLFVALVGNLAVVLAWEAFDFWKFLNKRTVPKQKGTEPRTDWKIPALALSAAATWCLPSVTHLGEIQILLPKLTAFVTTIILTAILIKERYYQIRSQGFIDRASANLARTLLILSVVHIGVFVIPMTWTKHVQNTTFYKTHLDMMAYLAQNAPRDARILSNTNFYLAEEMTLHFTHCENRPDLIVVSADPSNTVILPEDYIIWINIAEPRWAQGGLRKFETKFKASKRQMVEISNSGMVFDAYLAQPGRLIPWLLGGLDPGKEPPIRWYNGLFGPIHFTWTLYLPEMT